MHHDPPTPSLADYCRKDEFAHHPNNPLKKSEFDWVFRNRSTNGFCNAFVKVNERKFLVYVPGFLEALASRRGS